MYGAGTELYEVVLELREEAEQGTERTFTKKDRAAYKGYLRYTQPREEAKPKRKEKEMGKKERGKSKATKRT